MRDAMRILEKLLHTMSQEIVYLYNNPNEITEEKVNQLTCEQWVREGLLRRNRFYIMDQIEQVSMNRFKLNHFDIKGKLFISKILTKLITVNENMTKTHEIFENEPILVCNNCLYIRTRINGSPTNDLTDFILVNDNASLKEYNDAYISYINKKYNQG